MIKICHGHLSGGQIYSVLESLTACLEKFAMCGWRHHDGHWNTIVSPSTIISCATKRELESSGKTRKMLADAVVYTWNVFIYCVRSHTSNRSSQAIVSKIDEDSSVSFVCLLLRLQLEGAHWALKGRYLCRGDSKWVSDMMAVTPAPINSEQYLHPSERSRNKDFAEFALWPS